MSANPDQLKISLEFEKRPKATEVAMQEITGGQIKWRYKTVEEPEAKLKEKEKEQEPEDETES